jgi:hypothetical protein
MKLHGNAALSLKKRRLLCRRVVEEDWSLTEAAAAAEVSERTAGKFGHLSSRPAGCEGRPLRTGRARATIATRRRCT